MSQWHLDELGKALREEPQELAARREGAVDGAGSAEWASTAFVSTRVSRVCARSPFCLAAGLHYRHFVFTFAGSALPRPAALQGAAEERSRRTRDSRTKPRRLP